MKTVANLNVVPFLLASGRTSFTKLVSSFRVASILEKNVVNLLASFIYQIEVSSLPINLIFVSKSAFLLSSSTSRLIFDYAIFTTENCRFFGHQLQL